MPKWKDRICKECSTVEFTASKSEVCRPCAERTKKEIAVQDELAFIHNHGYSVIAETTLNKHNHRYYTLATPCGHEWKVTFTNLIKQTSVATQKNLPPPCGICGGKRRMKTALDGYVEKYGIDYDLAKYKDYMKKVRSLTGTTYRQHKAEINPNNLPRGHHTYHVDHKTPIIECFKQGWTPEQAAAKENLQMLLATENLSKGASIQ